MLRILACLLAFACAGAAAQDVARSKVVRAGAWDPGAAAGRCQLRIWVDGQARVRIRGDEIWVQTETGERAFDQGSTCNQPLPFRSIDTFRFSAENARGGIEDLQRPTRRNNFTGSLVITDPAPGGALHVVDLSWQGGVPGPAERFAQTYTGGTAIQDPLPAYDDLRACQDKVRATFLQRSATDAYLEFVGIPEREDIGRERDRIVGTAYARNRSVTRTVSYECVLNERTQSVESAAFRYPGATASAIR